MHATLEDWKNGWFGLHLGLTPAEIDQLVLLLYRLTCEAEQHFHLSSDYIGDGGLGESQRHNMRVGGLAFGPGDDIPDAVA